jgi:hypothetical protein
MSDGDVGNSRDSLDDAPPDSFWEIGMFKRTVKRIEDGDRICDQMIKVHFFSFLFGTKLRISRASLISCPKTKIGPDPGRSRARKPKPSRIGSDSANFSARKPEIRPKPYFVPEMPNLVGSGTFLDQKSQFSDEKTLY